MAFVQVTVNEKDNKYESSLYTVPAAGGTTPVRITGGTRDTTPRWSPDGKWIAFVRPNDKETPQIFLLPMRGGEARALTDLPKGAGGPVWSPDGKTIAFTSTTVADDMKKPDPAAKPERKSDVKVVTRAVYRANGNPTYVDADRHAHIWTVPVPRQRGEKAEAKAITSGEFDERGAQWSPDGATIYFVSDRVAESYYSNGRLRSLSRPGGGRRDHKGRQHRRHDRLGRGLAGRQEAGVCRHAQRAAGSLLQPAGPLGRRRHAGKPSEEPDRVLRLRRQRRDRRRPVRAARRKPEADRLDQGRPVADHRHRGEGQLESEACPDRQRQDGSGHDRRARHRRLHRGEGRGTIAATISTQTAIGDIAVLKTADGPAKPPVQVTHVNDPLFSEIAQSEPEEIWYSSFDGRKVQGWILKPPDFDPSKKYPMILEIHGGPHAAYGNVYTHEFQWMAAKGYVVLFTNPRGSTSYGQEFGNLIQYRYPGDDYKDLMAGVDEVVKRGYVDPNRLGVTGGSGGGLLTNWTITQTQRFKAAVSQRDIADWYGFWFTADFTLFQPTWFRKAPWEDPQDFAERSPITHVANVTTPLMLVLGDADYRTPPADGGEMMFRALKYRKIPTVMVRFPRETHELSRSGEPMHRVERLQHIVGWMDKWLQGKLSSTYP